MTNQKYMRHGLKFARAKAIEELGELQAALGKSLRWGWLSYNPELPSAERESNADWVRREMADVRGALDNLEYELRGTPVGVIAGSNAGSDDGGNTRSSFG